MRLVENSQTDEKFLHQHFHGVAWGGGTGWPPPLRHGPHYLGSPRFFVLFAAERKLIVLLVFRAGKHIN